MGNWFWNPTQHRLRTLWRLLLALVIGITLLLPFSCMGAALLLAQNAELLTDAASLDVGQLFVGQGFLLVQAVISLLITALTAWIAARFVDRRPWADLGWHINRQWWLDLGFGLLLGAALMAIIFGVERLAGWVSVTDTMTVVADRYPFEVAMAGFAIIYVCVGIYEELLVRGYLLRNLAEGLVHPVWAAKGAVIWAWAITSALFGLLHAANPNASVASTAALMASGLFLGLGYVLTGELALPIGLHISWNFVQGAIFGFPVSGLGSSASVLATTNTGPAIWTGGAFGPEAGLMGLGALLVGSALTYGWVRWTRGSVRIRRHLATYVRPMD